MRTEVSSNFLYHSSSTNVGVLICALANEMTKCATTVKPVLSDHSKGDQKHVFNANNRLMQVISIAEWNTFMEHSATLSICMELPHILAAFVLSILVAA